MKMIVGKVLWSLHNKPIALLTLLSLFLSASGNSV